MPMTDPIDRRVCLLTGASGYLGSRVKRALVRRGWRVIELTRHPDGGSDSSPFRLGDDIRGLMLPPAEALVHCAYDFSLRRSSDIHRVNVDGSAALLRAARDAPVERLIYISSISAFKGCRSVYGLAKLATEAIAHSLNATVIRPGLIWGTPAGAMFGTLVDQVASARVLPLVGGGAFQYLVHEDDLTDAIARFAEGTIRAPQGPITIAHPQPWTIRQLLREIANANGKQVSFVPVPWRPVWAVLRIAELCGIRAPFRSDSLVSLMNQNPQPTFALLDQLNVVCRRFGLQELRRRTNVGTPTTAGPQR
jgi:nucleoside-diphosphate-sugar epimerase